MTQQSLFQVAVLRHRKNKNGVVTKTEVVVEPETVLASGDQHARSIVINRLPKKLIEKRFDELEVRVRPF